MSKTALTTGIIVILCVTAGFNSVAHAQPVSPIFEDVTIQHPLSPNPLTVRGMSGGAIPGNKIAGKAETQPTGPCKGFMDEVPKHTVKLTNRFDYLKFVVQSPADTTMIIKGPGGTWCNDDFDGKNPGIVGEWLPGTYQIWIGSYEKNEYLPYTLKIIEVK
jgi:hypothetical protein